MNVETAICEVLKSLLEARLEGVQVVGNWVCDNATIKGLESKVRTRIDLTVSPRKYDSYTGNVAEFTVTIEGSFTMARDTTLDETRDAYDTITALLEEWRKDIKAVKRDLTIGGGFDPVGLRLDGGTFGIDADTKTRNYTQQFTLKGRVEV